MDRKSIYLLKYIITFFIIISSFNCFAENEKQTSQKEQLDKIAAIVNDDIVTSQEIDIELDKAKSGFRAQRIVMPSDKELTKQILNRLIDEKIQLQLADLYGMNATDAQVKDALENIAQKNNLSLTNLKYALLKEGIEFSDFRDNLKKQLTIQNVQQSSIYPNINISKQEINQFAKNLTKDNSTKKYHLGHILLSFPDKGSKAKIAKLQIKAKNLTQELKQKKISFKTAAIKNSDSNSALEGGDLGLNSLKEMPDLFVEHVANMRKGEIKGPIQDENGLHIITLFDIKKNLEIHKIQKYKVRHILIKTDNITSDTAARMQLDGIKENIMKGDKDYNFEIMAKRYSEDPQSSNKGGNIGWVSEEDTSLEFIKNITKQKI